MMAIRRSGLPKTASRVTRCNRDNNLNRHGQQRVNLLPGFLFFLRRLKAKPSGLPDSNFIFFVATKKTKQKKACSWQRAMSCAQLSALNKQQSAAVNFCTSPAHPEALESLCRCGELIVAAD
jgi:hypothetical protein